MQVKSESFGKEPCRSEGEDPSLYIKHPHLSGQGGDHGQLNCKGQCIVSKRILYKLSLGISPVSFQAGSACDHC